MGGIDVISVRAGVHGPRRVGLVVAIGLALASGAASNAAADTSVGSLGEGQSEFWDGSYVSSERVDDPSLCGIEGPCINYTIDVTSDHAKLLRVGLRTPDDSNGWQVVLIDPSGNQAASGTTYTLNGVAEDFDVDVWAHNPARGKWTVEVVPQNVQNGTFKMRAAVDPAASWPGPAPIVSTTKTVRTSVRVVRVCHTRRVRGHRVRHCVRRSVRVRHVVQTTKSTPRTGVYDMPPDLAADAPWHLTFEQPLPMVVVEGGNFTAMAGMHNTNTSVAGQPTYGCLPEETIEQGPHRCLRFTSGFASLGPGKFEVFGSSSGPVAPSGGSLSQNVYRSDGTHYTRPAGQFEFHPYHAHYHVLGIAQFQIFRVVGDHQLVTAGTVLKEGFCLGDIKMFNWDSWAQSEINPSSIDNCEPSPQSDGTWRFYEGIDSGWEDSYKWQTSGQFVNFDTNPDGYYVLRVTVNPQKLLLESDSGGQDTNNVAYTYFKVTGNDVYPIERGRGTDPWDPHKQVLNPTFGE
jgi:Lysyl oxidase